MKKIKILKATPKVDCDDYYDGSILHPSTGDWDEVTDSEFYDIQDMVRYANSHNSNKDFKYILVEYHERILKEVFETASEFKNYMKKQKEKQEKAAAEAKRKREEKAQERKRKQLEKLKKELGET